MPIKSYVLHYKESEKENLLNKLNTIDECEAIPAKDHNVVVVVTDTSTEEIDNELYKQLLQINGVKHLSLVSGFNPK